MVLGSNRVLFEAALQDYERQTGVSLTTHPLAKRLVDANTNDSLQDSLTAFLQEQTFKGGDGRVINPVKNILSVLCTLPFGEDIGLVHLRELMGVPSH